MLVLFDVFWKFLKFDICKVIFKSECVHMEPKIAELQTSSYSSVCVPQSEKEKALL